MPGQSKSIRKTFPISYIKYCKPIILMIVSKCSSGSPTFKEANPHKNTLNPDPMGRLIGTANEDKIVNDGK